MKFKLSVLPVLAATLFAGAAHASPTVYFGEDQSPGMAVGGAPKAAHDNFLAQLSGVGTENFESFATGTVAPMLTFPGSSGSITATISGPATVNGTPGLGRFNTSSGGSKFLEVEADAFTISFSEGISAFGFYGTDIGDFGGQLKLTLAGGGTVDLVVPNTINSADGSLLFFGFIDTGVKYTGITFGNSAGASDVFGFDDMVIGDRQQVTGRAPEPGTFALMGLALAGLGFARRRQS